MAAVEQVLAIGATAVLAFNDLVAIGVVHGLLERGVRVPEKVSVTGFDDIPFARFMRGFAVDVHDDLDVDTDSPTMTAADLIAQCRDHGGTITAEQLRGLRTAPDRCTCRARAGGDGAGSDPHLTWAAVAEVLL